MCYNNYGDNMKINIFDKALSLLLDKVSLVKPISQNDIIASYQVHMSEALTDTTYYYVRTKDGKEALYLCPGYKFIAGEKFLVEDPSGIKTKLYRFIDIFTPLKKEAFANFSSHITKIDYKILHTEVVDNKDIAEQKVKELKKSSRKLSFGRATFLYLS